MKNIFLVFSVLFWFSPLTMGADQIERETQENVPQGVLVKVIPETKTVEVFQAPQLDAKIVSQSATTQEIETAIAAAATSANKIAEFRAPQGELDRESSTDAYWRIGYGRYGGYRGYGGYGRWGWHGWGGYRPYYYNWYRPYSYYPGYFNYSHYYYPYRWNYGNYGWYY
jgi:hypothetical protein